MIQLKSISIEAFKAFSNKQKINLNNNNLLIYGENGSGKSSVYWALYTILQSANKSASEIDKYFAEFKPGYQNTHQTLVNRDAKHTDASISIELDIGEEEPKKYTIKEGHQNTVKDPDLTLFNDTSDFINYKLLQNFSAATNREAVNLWRVFERDIFPFIKSVDPGKNLLDYIQELTQDVPRTKDGAKVYHRSKRNYTKKLDKLNQQIVELIERIEERANAYLKDYFFEGKNVLSISLDFTRQWEFDLVARKVWRDRNTSLRKDSLKIEMKAFRWSLAKKDWELVPRPHSFLNEANMTKVAFAMRLAALVEHPQLEKTGILVLDDILISMDMVNRKPLVKVLLQHYTQKTQTVIFTHEPGFFDYLKSEIRSSGQDNWIFYEALPVIKDGIPAPIISEKPTHLERARNQYNQLDFEAAGNYLRKSAEEFSRMFLPKRLQFDAEGKPHDHSAMVDKCIKYASQNQIKPALFKSLDDHRKHVFNVLSHDAYDYPKFKEELDESFATLEELWKIRVLEIHLGELKLKIEMTDQKGDHYEYKALVFDELRSIEFDDETFIPKVRVHFEIWQNGSYLKSEYDWIMLEKLYETWKKTAPAAPDSYLDGITVVMPEGQEDMTLGAYCETKMTTDED